MSLISGTIGAVMGSSAQRDTARKNLEAAERTNEANYRMFREGRGEGGHAFLPIYMGDREQTLAKDAMSFYDQSKALMGSPAEQFAKYQQAIEAYQPMQAAARNTVADAFNGNITNTRIGYLNPVNEARTKAAQGQKAAIFQGLQERINQLQAADARKGFTGTSSFAQNRMLGSTIGARQDAANVLGMADVANAQDTRQVYDDGMNLRLQMLDRPYQMAQNDLMLQMLPLNQVQQNFSRSLAPFEFFRMGPEAFRADPLPMQPNIPSAGQIAMTAAGAANQQLANYFMQQQQAKNYQNAMKAWGMYQNPGSFQAATGSGNGGFALEVMGL